MLFTATAQSQVAPPTTRKVDQQLALPRDFASIQLVRLGDDPGIACACPVGLGMVAYTAKHVTSRAPNIWIDPLDLTVKGAVRVATEDPILDLATVARVGDGGTEFFPHPHQIAKHPPYAGEEIIVDGAMDYIPTRWYGRVVALKGGLLFLDVSGWPGTSGGCVISLKTGEVYAIVNGPTVDSNEMGFERALLRTTPIWGRK